MVHTTTPIQTEARTITTGKADLATRVVESEVEIKYGEETMEDFELNFLLADGLDWTAWKYGFKTSLQQSCSTSASRSLTAAVL